MRTRSLKEWLISEDGCSNEEADELIAEARRLIKAGCDPREVVEEVFAIPATAQILREILK